MNNPEVSTHAIRVYRGWRDLEKRDKSGIDVIDLDLVPDEFRFRQFPFESRVQVLGQFHRLSEGVDTSTTAGEYLHAKFISSIVQLGAMRGIREPFDFYIEDVLGITPEFIPGDVIEDQAEKTKTLFRQFGNGELNPTNWEAFHETARLLPEDREKTFIEAQEKFIPYIQGALGDNSELEYKTKKVELEVPWINSVSADAQGVLFRVNLHDINKHRWIKGIEELLVIHEIGGHVLQAVMHRRNIRDGLIDLGYGITTVPGPEQWSFEGMADNLIHLVPGLYNILSPHAQFLAEYGALKQLVYNNIHIRVNEPNPDLDILTNEVKGYAPNEPESRIRFMLDLLRNSIKSRAYQYTYEHGGYYYRNVAASLPDDKKIVLLKEHYKRPMTPAQAQREVQMLQSAA